MFAKKNKQQQDDRFYDITSFLANLENDSTPSIISTGTVIKGQFDFKVAEIMGFADGIIKSNFLHIRDGGVVSGTIIADHIKISGSFSGSITARIVTLCKTAVVEAEIKYAYLIVSDGVMLNGSCVFDESLKQSPEKSICEIL
jgi:cytoskeletal protein CcmA (bactofilin family)